MKNKAGIIILYTFLGVMMLELLQGCRSSSRKCGCGSDLMSAYKRPRRR